MNHQAWQLPCGRSNPLNVGNSLGRVDGKTMVARRLCDMHSSYTNSVKMTMQKTQMARTEVKLINVNKKDNYSIEIKNISKQRIRKTHNQRRYKNPKNSSPFFSYKILHTRNPKKIIEAAIKTCLNQVPTLLFPPPQQLY